MPPGPHGERRPRSFIASGHISGDGDGWQGIRGPGERTAGGARGGLPAGTGTAGLSAPRRVRSVAVDGARESLARCERPGRGGSLPGTGGGVPRAPPCGGLHAVNLPGSSVVVAITPLHGLTRPTSAPFRVRAPARIRRVRRETGGGPATLPVLPRAFRPPAFASWAILPPLADRPPSRSAHRPHGPDPNGIVTFHT